MGTMCALHCTLHLWADYHDLCTFLEVYQTNYSKMIQADDHDFRKIPQEVLGFILHHWCNEKDHTTHLGNRDEFLW